MITNEPHKDEVLINKGELRLDVLKAFGADLDTKMTENIAFANKALCYPVGRHLILRDIFNPGDARKNESMFIYLEKEIMELTSLTVSKDSNLLLVGGECEDNSCELCVYNLSKLTFLTLSIFKPKRKIITNQFVRFIYASFSPDANNIACIGETPQGDLKGIIYDIQAFHPFKVNNYLPKNIFDLPQGVSKITYENRVICTSGQFHLSFWSLFENTCKEYKSSANVNKVYVDHTWIENDKSPTIGVVTEDNEVLIFNALFETNKMSKKPTEDAKIERFGIKQTLSNIFHMLQYNDIREEKEEIKSTAILSYSKGLLVGSHTGNIFFIEKTLNGDYVPVRYTLREKRAGVVNFAVSSNNEEFLAISFNTNEIAYIGLNNIMDNLKNEKYQIDFKILCDGFHNGPISAMDVAKQRPIIVTTSKKDRTVRLWNYLTGHCEYNKIILESKENNEENEIEILSVAIHPNGYYLAISDTEMIRFFHLCYKELRFYNNDQTGNDQSKPNCELLKFSNGGHLLVAVQDKKIYLIRSYSRETVKTLNSPHSASIISIYFHDNDNYLYSVGSDGIIVQYNLFDFNYNKIASKYISYTGSGLCPILSPNKEDVVFSCGFENSISYYISKCAFFSSKVQEANQSEFSLEPIDVKGSAICAINTKRYEINSLAVGTEDGSMCLFSGLDSEKEYIQWDETQAHRKEVSVIYFSRDTNLLFSAGKDGNLFVYCIYEYPDGMNANFEDNNKVTALNQLNSILDEELGDNVLFNLYELIHLYETISSKQQEIYRLQKLNDEANVTFQKQLREKELDLNKKKDIEVGGFRDKINELTIHNESTKEQFKKEIEDLNEENRLKLKQRDQYLNEKIEELNSQIKDLKDSYFSMEQAYEIQIKNTDYDTQKKFREIEYAFKKKFNEFSDHNSTLLTELKDQKETEKRKMNIIDAEHEIEVNNKLEWFDKKVMQYEKELDEKSIELSKYKDAKAKLEQQLAANETESKKLKDDNDHLIMTISNLRKQLDMKEIEKENFTKKLSECEQNLQEKSKLEGFSNQLKNELYKKNYELSAKFNNELSSKAELKDTSRTLEKQLEETILLLLNKEKELSKYHVLVEELKQRWENQRHETNLIKKDYDNLLKKIYDTFQSNDKNTIVIGIREIYHHYLSHDADKKFDSNRLNINLRNELERQIDYLHQEVSYLSNNKARKDKFHQGEFQKQMNENSMLIEEMTRIKRENSEMITEVKKLRFHNKTLTHELDQIKSAMTKMIKNQNASLLNASQSQNSQNTGSNINAQTSPSVNINISGPLNLNNISGSISALQSDLPIINLRDLTRNSQVVREPSEKKNFRNRIFKPGMLTIPNEKLLKYSEMKRIIDTKNDIIQQLTTQNHLLRQITTNTNTNTNVNANTNGNANVNSNTNANSNDNANANPNFNSNPLPTQNNQ